MAVPVYQSVGSATGATTDTVTITAPASIANNDILIATVYAESNTQVITPPSGFTSFARIENASYPFAVELFWKRAASESGNYVFTETGNGWGDGSIARISGCVTTETPIGAVGADNSGSSINPGASSITTTTADALVLFISANGDGFLMDTPPAGMTERYDTSNEYLATLDFPTPGATGAKTATLDGSNMWIAVLVELKSVAADGGLTAAQMTPTFNTQRFVSEFIGDTWK